MVTFSYLPMFLLLHLQNINIAFLITVLNLPANKLGKSEIADRTYKYLKHEDLQLQQ